MVGVAISRLEPTVWREGRFISPETRVYRLRHSSGCNLRICGEEHHQGIHESHIQRRVPVPDIHDRLHDMLFVFPDLATYLPAVLMK